MNVKVCTLLFLLRSDEILLAMKKRGFGAGRWNGVGGKIEPDETVEQAMIRECQEEINVTPLAFHKAALLDFTFPDGTLTMRGHVFLCTKWQGTPEETEEMAPRWFKTAAIPYGEMWSDDEYWLPQVLAGDRIRGSFTFDANEQMREQVVSPVASEQDLQ